MFRRYIILCLLKCVTETTQVTEGRKYFPRGLYLGQPCNKGLCKLLRTTSTTSPLST
jgi:hypothetical protein